MRRSDNMKTKEKEMKECKYEEGRLHKSWADEPIRSTIDTNVYADGTLKTRYFIGFRCKGGDEIKMYNSKRSDEETKASKLLNLTTNEIEHNVYSSIKWYTGDNLELTTDDYTQNAQVRFQRWIDENGGTKNIEVLLCVVDIEVLQLYNKKHYDLPKVFDYYSYTTTRDVSPLVYDTMTIGILDDFITTAIVTGTEGFVTLRIKHTMSCDYRYVGENVRDSHYISRGQHVVVKGDENMMNEKDEIKELII